MIELAKVTKRGVVIGKKYKGKTGEIRDSRTGSFYEVHPEVTDFHARLQRGLLADKLPQYVQYETFWRKFLRKFRNPDTLPKLRKIWGFM